MPNTTGGSKWRPMALNNSKHAHVSKYAFEHMEIPFPTYSSACDRTTSPTKINIIVSNIPLINARIMNLTFLSLGATMNLLIVLVILSKSSMRTSWHLYIVSMACSNMLILMEPLEEVLKWLFDRQTPFGYVLVKRYTTVKAIFLVWVSCTMSIAIGLHIYDFFEGDMADMYVWSTFMFSVLPLIIFVVLDSLIIYELMILKAIEGSWRSNQLRHYYMLVIIGIVFFLIRAPYRIARAINFIEPKALCCTDGKREVLYFMAKTFPIIFAIIYISLSTEFRKSLQVCLKLNFNLDIILQYSVNPPNVMNRKTSDEIGSDREKSERVGSGKIEHLIAKIILRKYTIFLNYSLASFSLKCNQLK
uniref:uncharacterized protein LOC117601277 isoform X2 n=1 Tax=Osmia lignaria TaxID=473952 RepID=UPI0014787CB2|nr:uncharacterized protein LOC117601277 isoform X2 [Osmia lignaria]